MLGPLKKHGLTDRDIAFETANHQGIASLHVADDKLTVLVVLDVRGGRKEAFVMRCAVHEGHIYISPEKAPDPKTGIFKPWILRATAAYIPVSKEKNTAPGRTTAVDTPKDEAAKKELAKLQGAWTAVSVEREGKTLSEAEVKKLDIRLTITGDEFMLMPLASKGPEHFPHGNFLIDPSKKPKAIDFTVNLPFQLDKKTSTVLGLYELDGDNLKLLRGRPDQQRPSEFKTTPKSDLEIIVFKRATPTHGS